MCLPVRGRGQINYILLYYFNITECIYTNSGFLAPIQHKEWYTSLWAKLCYLVLFPYSCKCQVENKRQINGKVDSLWGRMKGIETVNYRFIMVDKLRRPRGSKTSPLDGGFPEMQHFVASCAVKFLWAFCRTFFIKGSRWPAPSVRLCSNSFSQGGERKLVSWQNQVLTSSSTSSFGSFFCQ